MRLGLQNRRELSLNSAAAIEVWVCRSFSLSTICTGFPCCLLIAFICDLSWSLSFVQPDPRIYTFSNTYKCIKTFSICLSERFIRTIWFIFSTSWASHISKRNQNFRTRVKHTRSIILFYSVLFYSLFLSYGRKIRSRSRLYGLRGKSPFPAFPIMDSPRHASPLRRTGKAETFA